MLRNCDLIVYTWRYTDSVYTQSLSPVVNGNIIIIYDLQCFGHRKLFVLAAACSDKFWDPRNLLYSLYMG
jgi:hypothetical protein